MTSYKPTYEDAIQKLNELQSNKAAIHQIYKDIANGKVCSNLSDMENYLSRTNIPLSKLDELSVIHVAGTKGKGSTSAMCESILRQHGFRTGFYSSPHLIAVRERIRLDGHVVSKQKFATHFHEIYDMLYQTQKYPGDMPKYFSFLTVLAFHVFLKEEVDVAIVEVGIGGTVDYTNILRKVPVVGITALGLDHTSILGRTLPEIAAAKAGVMKRGCQAFTVRQPPDAMAVLRKVAHGLQCPLHIVPEYDSYTFPIGHGSCLPVDLPAYGVNASLAIQLAHAWMQTHGKNSDHVTSEENSLVHNGLTETVHCKNEVNRGYDRIIETSNSFNLKEYKKKDMSNGISRNIVNGNIELNDNRNRNQINGYSNMESSLITRVTNETANGLKSCSWPGRYQIIETANAKYYLDGAHTRESMEICAGWFSDNAMGNKALIFSATGDRNAKTLLEPLSNIPFQKLFFVIPSTYKEPDNKDDNYYKNQESFLLDRCHNHARIWKELSKNSGSSEIYVLECVADALKLIGNCDRSLGNPSVLITGSLYLVGAALAVLDPTLSRD